MQVGRWQYCGSSLNLGKVLLFANVSFFARKTCKKCFIDLQGVSLSRVE